MIDITKRVNRKVTKIYEAALNFPLPKRQGQTKLVGGSKRDECNEEGMQAGD